MTNDNPRSDAEAALTIGQKLDRFLDRWFGERKVNTIKPVPVRLCQETWFFHHMSKQDFNDAMKDAHPMFNYSAALNVVLPEVGDWLRNQFPKLRQYWLHTFENVNSQVVAVVIRDPTDAVLFKLRWSDLFQQSETDDETH